MYELHVRHILTSYTNVKYPVWTLPGLLQYRCIYGFDEFDKSHRDLTIKPSMRLIPNGLVDEEEAYIMWNVYAGLKLYAFLVKDKIGDSLTPVTRATVQGSMDETASATLDTLEWAQTFHATKLISNATFALDEATRGVKHMLNHNEVSIWVTLAMQMLFDVMDVFEIKATLATPFKKYRHTVRKCSTDFGRINPIKRPFLDGHTTKIDPFYKNVRNILKHHRDIAIDDH
jgi:hypothetical protein